MQALKRVRGTVLELTSDSVTVKTRKKTPVCIPFSELRQDSVSVTVYSGGEFRVGCKLDVIWWDGPAPALPDIGGAPFGDCNLSEIENSSAPF